MFLYHKRIKPIHPKSSSKYVVSWAFFKGIPTKSIPTILNALLKKHADKKNAQPGGPDTNACRRKLGSMVSN